VEEQGKVSVIKMLPSATENLKKPDFFRVLSLQSNDGAAKETWLLLESSEKQGNKYR